MLSLLQLFIICATLVQYSSEAPWETNNNVREYDLEWQCEQFCNRLKGKLNYNTNDSACICTVDTNDKLNFDSKNLEHKLNDLGLNFKIIDKTKANRIKRDGTVERIKKMLADRRKEEAPDTVAAGPNPENETQDKEKISIGSLHKLRSKHLPKDVPTAPDNLILGKALPNLETDHNEEKPSGINDNFLVGAAKIELPNKELEDVKNDLPDKQKNDKLNLLREKLNALKIAKPTIEVKKTKPDPIVEAKKTEPEPIVEAKKTEQNEEDKKKDEEETEVGIRRRRIFPLRRRILPANKPPIVNDKFRQLRERIRNRLHNIKEPNPNKDSDV